MQLYKNYLNPDCNKSTILLRISLGFFFSFLLFFNLSDLNKYNGMEISETLQLFKHILQHKGWLHQGYHLKFLSTAIFLLCSLSCRYLFLAILCSLVPNVFFFFESYCVAGILFSTESTGGQDRRVRVSPSLVLWQKQTFNKRRPKMIAIVVIALKKKDQGARDIWAHTSRLQPRKANEDVTARKRRIVPLTLTVTCSATFPDANPDLKMNQIIFKGRE